MSVRVYVEGGGDQRITKDACRDAFGKLFEKALGSLPKPKVIVGGSRQQTFDLFCTALKRGEADVYLLLVDAEAPVSEGYTVWQHLAARDGWSRPTSVRDDDAHLMVQCMEAWLLADRAALIRHYQQGFQQSALPSNTNLEAVSKQDLERTFQAATRNTTKGSYHKTRHGFALLALIDPKLIRERSPHAERFFARLESCAA